MKNNSKLRVLYCVFAMLLIAVCLCGCTDQSFPTAKQEKALKQAYLNLYNESGRYTTDDVIIECFHGQYGDALVALMNGLVGHTQALWSETVGNLNFEYHEGNYIVVLYKDEFIRLQQAFDDGVLTQSDLYKIWNIHKDKFGFLYNR